VADTSLDVLRLAGLYYVGIQHSKNDRQVEAKSSMALVLLLTPANRMDWHGDVVVTWQLIIFNKEELS
jgi:hypothetical protein